MPTTRASSCACMASGAMAATSTFSAKRWPPTHRVLAIDMPGRGESDWLADPNDYMFPTYLTTLVALIARSGAGFGGLDRDVDGRPPRHGRRGATEQPDRAPRRQRRRAGHRAGSARPHPRLFRDRSGFRDLRRDRALRPHDFGTLRTPHRRAVGARHAHQRPATRGRPLAARLRSRHRGAVPGVRRTAGPVGRLGRDPLPDAACCAARNPIFFRPARPHRWPRAGRSRARRIRGRRSRAHAAYRRAGRTRRALSPCGKRRRPAATMHARARRRPAGRRAQSAGIAYNRGRPWP